jgi:peptide/nickel transport system substrate-binding protein
VSLLCAGMVAAFAVTGGGSASAANNNKPVKGGTLTWSGGCNNPKLDPAVAVATNASCGAEMTPIYDVLLYEDPTDGFKIKYKLAESLTTKDGINWVLKLRPNLKFTDNTPLDAAAVKSIWERHKDPAVRSTQSAQVANIASMTAADPTTLNITLTTAQSSFPRTVARNLEWIPSPTAIAKYGTSYGTSPETTVGAGPYILKQWLKDSQLSYDKNPDYYDAPKPYPDHLVYLVNSDLAGLYNTFKSGQAQGTLVGTTTMDQAKADGVNVVLTPSTGVPDVRMLNVTIEPFNNPKVRQAMNYAIDPKALNATFYSGKATQLKKNYLIPEGTPYFNSKMVFPSYDPKKAQALFDEVAKETGKPVEIKHLGAGGSCPYGEAIQTILSKYQNVKVSPECLVVTDYVTQIQQKKFQYALWVCPGNIAADPDPGLYDCFQSQSRTNITGYSNPELDAALAEGRSAGTTKERKAAYDKVQEILVKDLPLVVVPLSAGGLGGMALAKNLKGFEMRTWGPDFSTMWLTKA